jgi:hypothetical protein
LQRGQMQQKITEAGGETACSGRFQ